MFHMKTIEINFKILQETNLAVFGYRYYLLWEKIRIWREFSSTPFIPSAPPPTPSPCPDSFRKSASVK